jgi:DNA-binding XRE family transcriptional regulator
VQVTFRSGHTYQVSVADLGVEGRIGFATVGEDPRAVILGLLAGDMLDVPSTAVLTLAEPAYRAAVTRRAASVGERVRALRLAAERTATSVAAAAGMARPNFARLEAGRHEPRLGTLRRVADALGVPLDALLG